MKPGEVCDPSREWQGREPPPQGDPVSPLGALNKLSQFDSAWHHQAVLPVGRGLALRVRDLDGGRALRGTAGSAWSPV